MEGMNEAGVESKAPGGLPPGFPAEGFLGKLKLKGKFHF